MSRKLNPIFVIAFPFLILPLAFYFMSRPWIILDKWIEEEKIWGIPIWKDS